MIGARKSHASYAQSCHRTEPLTPLRAERYHLDVDEGLVVTEVLRDSVAGKAGIRTGDVVLQLGRFRVLDVK